jgi:zinc transporter ZupT
MGEALAYLAAGVTAAWGVAHIMPTGRVVAGFGNLSKDNRLILAMDWVAEGFTLVLLGVLVAVVTMRGGSADPVTQAAYAVAAGALLVFAVWTAATAARGSAEPTLSTAAAGFARGPSLRAGSWSARPRAPKRTALPRPGRVPVTV